MYIYIHAHISIKQLNEHACRYERQIYRYVRLPVCLSAWLPPAYIPPPTNLPASYSRALWTG